MISVQTQETKLIYKNEKRRWKVEFTFLVVTTAILSGIAFLGQNYYFENYYNSTAEKTRTYYNIVRSIRMFLLYVVPVLVFTKRWDGNYSNLGIMTRKGYLIANLTAGIFLYSMVGILFVKNRIFFNSWTGLELPLIGINFILVGFMASITDFWTRGFILFSLAKNTSDQNAIFWQNVVWFVIHLYEIELLVPFIGLLNSILLTLAIGIGGDLIALRTKSIFGLMLGHIILNLMILMAAKDLFPLTLI